MLVQVLRAANAPVQIVDMVKNLSCAVCEARRIPRPRRVATLEAATELHAVLQSDQFE